MTSFYKNLFLERYNIIIHRTDLNWIIFHLFPVCALFLVLRTWTVFRSSWMRCDSSTCSDTVRRKEAGSASCATTLRRPQVHTYHGGWVEPCLVNMHKQVVCEKQNASTSSCSGLHTWKQSHRHKVCNTEEQRSLRFRGSRSECEICRWSWADTD